MSDDPRQKPKERILFVAAAWATIITAPVIFFSYFRRTDPNHRPHFEFLKHPVTMPFIWFGLIFVIVFASAFFLGLRRTRFKSAGQSLTLPPETQPKRGLQVNATAKVVTDHLGRTLAVSSLHEHFAIEMQEHETGDVKEVMFRVRNDRLGTIGKIKLTIYTAQSFDSRHKDFREPQTSGIVVLQSNTIPPSSSGAISWLVAKKIQNRFLFVGDSTSNQMVWPENDKSETQIWRLTMQLDAHAIAPREEPKPLPQIKFVADVDWNTTTNQFSIRQA